MHFASNGAASAGAERSRFACTIAFADVALELDALIEKAVSAVAGGVPAPDAILGRYVGLAGLIRAVSFHEGRLLEEAIAVLARRNADLVVLTQGLRLPVTPAALDAIANNAGRALRGLSFDADARTRASYTPDLVIVHRAAHRAYVLDIKRSILSYLDTHRLAELKTRMMAGALILPDWLYKEHRRLMVDEVGIAIVDGASGPSDHESGIWAMSEIDDLLEIDGAATAMDELRQRFARRIQRLLDGETGKLMPDTVRPPASTPDRNAQPLRQTMADEGDARSIRIGFARMRLHA